MKEEFLHFLWKQKLVGSHEFISTTNKQIKIVKYGDYNLLEGPDVLYAQIEVDDILWVGHIEFHLKSSDWYTHNHEQDKNYSAVILHIVWEHDIDVYNLDNDPLLTVELQQVIQPSLINKYLNFFQKNQEWIPCAQSIKDLKRFTMIKWQERLFIERLESKSIWISEVFSRVNYDWDRLLNCVLAKSFGLQVNGIAFYELIYQIPSDVLRKTRNNIHQLTALLFGQANLLYGGVNHAYQLELQKEYEYLKHKFSLKENPSLKIQFYGNRPSNFPTIRLAQLACLFQKEQLFSYLMNNKTKEDYMKTLQIELNEFWINNYSFSSTAKRKNRGFTSSFIDLLLINAVIPLKFFYLKSQGKLESDLLIDFVRLLLPEKNAVINKFKELGINSENAFETQALIQLKNNYCAEKRCLQCAIGVELIKK